MPKLDIKSYLIEKNILWAELKKEGFDTDSIVNFMRCLDEHDKKPSREHRLIGGKCQKISTH